MKQETLVESKDNLSAVTCLDSFDLYGDGKEELIVGRRDGTIQVFTMMMLENNDLEMDCQQLLYEENFNESISCVFGGCIGATGYTEIIACTYTGKVFGLTTRTLGDVLTDGKSNNNYEIVTDAAQRIQKLKYNRFVISITIIIISLFLRSEIEFLEQAVIKEREKYQLSTQAISSGLSAIPVMTINDSV